MTKINAEEVIKTVNQTNTLSKRQMELMTEAVMSNLQEIVNKGSRKEIEHLKAKLVAEKKARRKVAARLRYIKTELKTAQFELAFLDDDAFSPNIQSQTPKQSASRDINGALNN